MMKKILFALLLLSVTALKAQTNYVMDFNGSNASVDIGSVVGNAGIRSIEFWFKPNFTISPSTSIGGWGLVARNDNSEMYEYGIYIRGNEWTSNIGNLVFTRRDNGVNHEVFSNSNTWTAGVWYHVAGVIDPVNGMKLYINGVLQTSTDASTMAVETDVNANTSNIATWGNAGVRYFDGRIEEMRFWSRSISQNEIQTKMCQNLTPANETGLIAYWKFNEGSGSQILDATANNYDGTVSSSTWVVDNPCSNSSYYVLDFNGTNSGVNLGPSVGNGVRSIEFWFKPTVSFTSSTTIGGWTLIARDDNTQFHEYGIYMRGNSWTSNIGKLAFFVRDNGTMHEIYSNSSSWTAGTWYHVAGVADASTGMKLYINGVLQTSMDASGTGDVQVDTNPTYLGTWGAAGVRYFDGRMDELRLWNRAITQAEVQAKMCQSLVPANETGLQGYWHFDEGSGSQVLDATGGASTGTVTAVTWIPENFCGIGVAGHNKPAMAAELYPNPANDVVNIVVADDNEGMMYVLFNTLGEAVVAGKISSAETRLGLGGLSAGVYYLVLSKGTDSSIEKICIQR